LKALDARRETNDFLALSAIAEELQLPLDGVRQAIRTGAGQDALAALTKCHEHLCSREESKAAVDQYKIEIMATTDAPFFELMLLDMSANRCTR
jgi:hypothetical protein